MRNRSQHRASVIAALDRTPGGWARIAAILADEQVRHTQPAEVGEEWLTVDVAGSGVYRLIDDDGRTLYVGQSQTVAARVSTHLKEGRIPFKRAIYLPTPVSMLMDLERTTIIRWNPPYNRTRPFVILAPCDWPAAVTLPPLDASRRPTDS